jgi:hypothetical protein
MVVVSMKTLRVVMAWWHRQEEFRPWHEDFVRVRGHKGVEVVVVVITPAHSGKQVKGEQ